MQRSGKPRFADTGFAGEQHHLAFAQSLPLTSAAAAVRVLPRDRQARSIRSRAVPRSGFRLKLDRKTGQGFYRASHPLNFLCAEVLQIEEVAEEPSRALSDDHRVRLCNNLQTGRKIRVSPTTACS